MLYVVDEGLSAPLANSLSSRAEHFGAQKTQGIVKTIRMETS